MNQAGVRFQRGSNFKFVRAQGGWKFDFFRTTLVPPAQLRRLLEASIPKLAQTEHLVRSGEFANIAAAADDFQSYR